MLTDEKKLKLAKEIAALSKKQADRKKLVKEKETRDKLTPKKIAKILQGQKAAAAFRAINEEKNK